MDLNDIWQEHKRFILSLAIGAIAFLVGYMVITGQFDTTGLERRIQNAKSMIRKADRYDRSARQEFAQAREKLEQRYRQGRNKVAFKVREPFSLQGKGDPRPHYFLVTEQVKSRVRAECNRSDVRLDDTRGAASLGLPQASPTDKEQIERTLVGLDLADRMMTRLLAADAEAVSRNRQARGLREVSRMAIDIGTLASSQPRQGRRQEAGLFDKVRVQARFLADSHTVKAFLQRVVQGENPIQVEEFTAGFPREEQKMLLVDLTLCAPLMREGE